MMIDGALLEKSRFAEGEFEAFLPCKVQFELELESNYFSTTLSNLCSLSANLSAKLKIKSGGNMLGAIVGDVLGSSFEFYPMKTKKLEILEKNSHFTDDSVMTVAVADSIMNGVPYTESLQKWGRKIS